MPRLITLITLAFISIINISANMPRQNLMLFFSSPPVAVDDSYNVHGNFFLPGNSTLANDYDADGDILHLAGCTQAAHGTVTCTYQYNSFSYHPAQGYVGSDSFTYQACDSTSCSTATVTLTVNNTPPTPQPDFYVVRGVPFSGNGMFTNDTDPDNDGVNFMGCGTASHGTVTCNMQYASFNYYAPGGYQGFDSFNYQVCDTWGLCTTTTVYLLVLPVGADPSQKLCGAPTDPGKCGPISPASGALSGATGGAAGSSGPQSPDPVNLTTGREIYAPEPDLRAYNPAGPEVVWRRAYLGYQALKGISGYGSPSLTRGWVHNYDISLFANGGSWVPVTLTYPNGTVETLTPQLSGVNRPEHLQPLPAAPT